MARGSKYTAYTGGPDPLAPPVDLREALEQIGQDVMEGTSPRRALAELLRRGNKNMKGADRLAAEVNRSQSGELSGLLRALGGMMGLLQAEPQAFLKAGSGFDEAWIADRIGQRAAAKAAKDFALADRIRRELVDKGIVLKDSAQGTTWEALR